MASIDHEVTPVVHPYVTAPDVTNSSRAEAARLAQRLTFPCKNEQAYTTMAKIYDENVAQSIYD